jgi:DNA-binding NarL/FixJ family response regulator
VTVVETVRVLVVEDDPAVRRSIELLVADAGHLVITASTARGALELFEERRPELVLLDLGLPDRDGVELLRDMRARSPETPVIVVSIVTDEASIVEAMRSGALGYLFKDDLGRLLPALKEALAGGAPMSPAVARLVLEQLRSPVSRARGVLTAREREVLEQLANGLRYDQIAIALDLSLNTVRAHVRNIYRKLDAATRLEAVLAGVRLGEIPTSWLFAEG